MIGPVRDLFAMLMRRFTPAGYVENTRRKLTIAGKPGNDAVDRFLAIQVVCAIIGLIAIPIVPQLISGGQGLLATLLVVAVFLLGPASQLNKMMAARQMAIRVALPDMLDLLTISVEAGLGFEQALDRTVKSVPGELSDEFARMLAETRAGASRADALRALEKRTATPEVRSFVLAILQADTFGVSIARVLRVQAEEMRIKRRQLAQEKAQKAPVKMLIPMVFCIFPSVFIIILGPAIINISRIFGGG
jgi:tight adherence protein C